MLTIYVDDFMLGGPKGNLAKGWKSLEGVLQLEPEPTGGRILDRYLGCKHIREDKDVPGVGKVTKMIFDMEDYMQSIVDDFEAYGRKLHGQL